MSFSIPGYQEEPRTCAFCEHFDGGGEKIVAQARGGLKVLGDCHCHSSPRFTTDSGDTCPQWLRAEELASIATLTVKAERRHG